VCEIVFELQVPLVQTGEVGWLAGKIGGHTGWFPETYVEKLDEGELQLNAPAAAVEPTPLE
jgi:intersectin